jgi:virulence factor Mce-like protein
VRRRVLVNAAIIVSFAVVCVGALEWLAANLGQPMPVGNAGYTVHGIFQDADGVPTDADVRVNGVDVGKVVKVGPDPGQPGYSVVTMTIYDSDAAPVYSNGFATIEPKSILNDMSVDLTVGGGGTATAIPSGGFLTVADTSTSVEYDQIFNSFPAPIRSDEQQVIADLDTATRGQPGNIQDELPRLEQAFADLEPVAAMYSADAPEVDAILKQLTTILQTTADEHEQLAGLLGNGKTALGAIAQRDDALVGTLQGFSTVATELNAAMTPTVPAQKQSLKEIGASLGAENRFLNQIVGPQAGCGGHPCGIDEVFTGTLLGDINYPNDQLTVTTPAGETVAGEWASMFSQPTDTHRALNLVLAFQCDTLPQELASLGPVLSAQQKTAVNEECRSVIFPGSGGGG